MALYQHSIAAGYNVPLISLTNIENIVVSNKRFYPPSALYHSREGQRVGRLNGVGFRRGFKSVDWIFGFLTVAQYTYLRTTYCSGGLSGQVTVYTRVGSATYQRYNAVIDVPETEGLGEFGAFHNVVITLSHMVQLS